MGILHFQRIWNSPFLKKEFETCKGNMFYINQYTYHVQHSLLMLIQISL